MTAPGTVNGATTGAHVPTGLGPALNDLRDAALRYAIAKASRTVDDWAGDLNAVAVNGGPTTQAVFGGLKAKLHGNNPVWAAVKGAWSGMSPELKLVAVLVVTLALLLGPVLLLALVLGLLVAALVAAIRAATR